MFSKTVTQEIVRAWAKGATAEETVKHLKENFNIVISLHTVYKKRHSLEAQEMIDELLRQQLREIITADNPELKLKYRNELLKILMPQKILSYSKQDISVNEQHAISITNNLNEFDSIIEEELARISAHNRAGEPVDSADA